MVRARSKKQSPPASADARREGQTPEASQQPIEPTPPQGNFRLLLLASLLLAGWFVFLLFMAVWG